MITLPDLITTPQGLLNPLAAAVAAEIIALWANKYLADWRYLPLLVLALSVGVEGLAAYASGLALTRANAFAVLWLGFLGASIAVFGREVIFNLLGLLDLGPRGITRIRHLLGRQRWE
jgi:hypothetical protein